jgi:murein DD-endopeptidase MepM/ murein hydrolase activator NlpD
MNPRALARASEPQTAGAFNEIFAALACSVAHARDAAIEIRFHPAVARPYALAAERGLFLLQVQNTAIINREAQPLTVTGVEFELLSSGESVAETRRLGTNDIARAAAGGAQLQASGMLELLAFQFGAEKLLPSSSKLRDSPTLAPGDALYIGPQVFAFRGARDKVRVRVKATVAGESLDASEALAVLGETKHGYRLPLKGTWYVGAGATPHSHHRWVVPQEFAFDLLRTGADGRTHRSTGTKRAEYFAYGETVFAAGPGKVVAAVGDEAETDDDLIRPGESMEKYFERVKKTQGQRLARGARGVVGNHIVIEHADGEHSVYAHLKPGSLKVKAGERVAAGQAIAAVGTSGNSTEPHLHFHIADGPDPMRSAGIPVRFDALHIHNADFPRPPQTGDFVEHR